MRIKAKYKHNYKDLKYKDGVILAINTVMEEGGEDRTIAIVANVETGHISEIQLGGTSQELKVVDSEYVDSQKVEKFISQFEFDAENITV